jgi:hypothetical protein
MLQTHTRRSSYLRSHCCSSRVEVTQCFWKGCSSAMAPRSHVFSPLLCCFCSSSTAHSSAKSSTSRTIAQSTDVNASCRLCWRIWDDKCTRSYKNDLQSVDWAFFSLLAVLLSFLMIGWVEIEPGKHSILAFYSHRNHAFNLWFGNSVRHNEAWLSSNNQLHLNLPRKPREQSPELTRLIVLVQFRWACVISLIMSIVEWRIPWGDVARTMFQFLIIIAHQNIPNPLWQLSNSCELLVVLFPLWLVDGIQLATLQHFPRLAAARGTLVRPSTAC